MACFHQNHKEVKTLHERNICNVLSLQAAQTDDARKTAGAAVSVSVEDVNDNPPEFDQPGYSVSLLENSPAGGVVFKAAVGDPDQVLRF